MGSPHRHKKLISSSQEVGNAKQARDALEAYKEWSHESPPHAEIKFREEPPREVKLRQNRSIEIKECQWTEELLEGKSEKQEYLG